MDNTILYLLARDDEEYAILTTSLDSEIQKNSTEGPSLEPEYLLIVLLTRNLELGSQTFSGSVAGPIYTAY